MTDTIEVPFPELPAALARLDYEGKTVFRLDVIPGAYLISFRTDEQRELGLGDTTANGDGSNTTDHRRTNPVPEL